MTEFEEFSRKICFKIYKNVLGWRRFFLQDYWRLVFGMRARKLPSTYNHSGHSNVKDYNEAMKKFNKEMQSTFFKNFLIQSGMVINTKKNK